MRSLPAIASRVFVVTALSGTMFICDGARGATLVPVTQNRSVHAFVIVPPCNPAIDSENDAAVGFEPFWSEVNAASICRLALGVSTASQNSSINAASIVAEGETFFDVLSEPNPTVIHAIPQSACSVTFQVGQPVRYFIQGELSAFTGVPIVVDCSASLRLSDAANQPIVQETATAAFGGGVITLPVHASGPLTEGQYTLTVDGISALDAIVPPSSEAASSFNIIAQFQRPGDANIDGVVNINDLLAVIGDWGPCPGAPAFCPLDMNADGSVEINDLLLVIGNWE